MYSHIICYTRCQKNDLHLMYSIFKNVGVDICDKNNNMWNEIDKNLANNEILFSVICAKEVMKKYIGCICKSDIFSIVINNAYYCLAKSYFDKELCMFKETNEQNIEEEYAKCQEDIIEISTNDEDLYDYFFIFLKYLNKDFKNLNNNYNKLKEILCVIVKKYHSQYSYRESEEEIQKFHDFVQAKTKFKEFTLSALQVFCLSENYLKYLSRNTNTYLLNDTCPDINNFHNNIDDKLNELKSFIDIGPHKFYTNKIIEQNLKLTTILSDKDKDPSEDRCEEVIIDTITPSLSTMSIITNIESTTTIMVDEKEKDKEDQPKKDILPKPEIITQPSPTTLVDKHKEAINLTEIDDRKKEINEMIQLKTSQQERDKCIF